MSIYNSPQFINQAVDTHLAGPSTYQRAPQFAHPRVAVNDHQFQDAPTFAQTTRDYELEQMRQKLAEMNSRVHEATSATLEIGRVLREAQNFPFTSDITPFRIPHLINDILPR
ncbi:unnamed protein product [Cochlearia groenlandica]